jgi:hypothetical protein
VIVLFTRDLRVWPASRAISSTGVPPAHSNDTNVCRSSCGVQSSPSPAALAMTLNWRRCRFLSCTGRWPSASRRRTTTSALFGGLSGACPFTQETQPGPKLLTTCTNARRATGQRSTTALTERSGRPGRCPGRQARQRCGTSARKATVTLRPQPVAIAVGGISPISCGEHAELIALRVGENGPGGL